MEIHINEISEQPSPSGYIIKRIDRRVERTLANPTLTTEQELELFVLANLTKITLDRGNPLTLNYGRQLIEFTDPLMVPEEASGEQK